MLLLSSSYRRIDRVHKIFRFTKSYCLPAVHIANYDCTLQFAASFLIAFISAEWLVDESAPFVSRKICICSGYSKWVLPHIKMYVRNVSPSLVECQNSKFV